MIYKIGFAFIMAFPWAAGHSEAAKSIEFFKVFLDCQECVHLRDTVRQHTRIGL